MDYWWIDFNNCSDGYLGDEYIQQKIESLRQRIEDFKHIYKRK
jgi:hypothetical protein